MTEDLNVGGTMRKAFLLGLPFVAVLLICGWAYSQSEPETPAPMQKPYWESFPRSGFRLGVVLSDNNGDLRGVAIEKIQPDSPADKAGLQEGDVIERIDGQRIHSSQDVRELLRNLENSRDLQVEVLREGNPLTVTVTPEKRDFPAFRHIMGGRRLGVNLQELNPDLAAYFQVDPNEGVLVARVEPDSPAEKAGIHAGDIITHIDGNKVNSAEDVSRMISEGDRETIEIIILRHGAEQKIIAKPEEGEFFNHRGAMPELRDLPRMMDSPEFKSEMENLRNEMRDLKDQLQGLRQEELDMMRDEIQNLLKQEMDKLRSELKEKKEL
jgi:membrane-associated protease RseP (regulator of RpoE activity)